MASVQNFETHFKDNVDEEGLVVHIQSIAWVDFPADHNLVDLKWLGTVWCT